MFAGFLEIKMPQTNMINVLQVLNQKFKYETG